MGLYLLFSLSFAQVTNLNDTGAGSLRDAITAAGEGDTITFQAGLSGTINVGVEIAINENDLTIDATGTTIAVDGQGTSRVFRHTGTGILTINNLTIQNGNNAGNGGGILSNGDVNIINSTLAENRSGVGGGIFVFGTATITNSIVHGNRADGFGGGGVVSIGGNVVMINSMTFGNFTVGNGGGVGTDSNIVLINSTVSGNRATNGGGAFSFGNTILNNSLVLGNDAPNQPANSCQRSPHPHQQRLRLRSWRIHQRQIRRCNYR
ncbi:MAG: hypothetical protein AAF267_18530 [Deinococcota bacterium]